MILLIEPWNVIIELTEPKKLPGAARLTWFQQVFDCWFNGKNLMWQALCAGSQSLGRFSNLSSFFHSADFLPAMIDPRSCLRCKCQPGMREIQRGRSAERGREKAQYESFDCNWHLQPAAYFPLMFVCKFYSSRCAHKAHSWQRRTAKKTERRLKWSTAAL